MTTAYNLRNKMYRSGAAGRQTRLDPGSGGTLIVTPVDRAVCTMSGAGARTLEAAANIGVGTTILLISQTDGVVVNGKYMNANEWGTAVVVENSSGTHAWVLDNSSTQNHVNLEVPCSLWRIHDAPNTVLLAGAGVEDDMGVNAGTYGTSVQSLNVLDNGGGGETFYARAQIVVPSNYIQGHELKLILTVNEVVACGTSASLDVSAYRVAVPDTDLIATAAQSIVGASDTDYSFTLTSTAIEPGDILDVRLVIVLTNAAGDRGDYDIDVVRLTTLGE